MLDWIQSGGTFVIFGGSFLFVTIFVALNRLLKALPSPVNKLLVRWVRLILVSFFFGLSLHLTILESVSLWRLWVIGTLVWGVFESIYAWVFIMAWDRSDFPLFPTMKGVDDVNWPANKRFFYIRDWIRKNQYESIGSVKYVHEGESLQQVAVFRSPDKKVVLQVMIIPDATGVIMDQVAFNTLCENGDRIITDNSFMPYGGAYPKTWMVKRYPSVRKIDILGSRHAYRLSNAGGGFQKFEEDLKEWMEGSQVELEKVNVDQGLLNSRNDRKEFGKLSGEGRYRIWLEFLCLNYFGQSLFTK